MGKRRKTAKTGDKSLYKKGAEARAAASQFEKKDNSKDDPMYDDVDQYHNQQDEDYLKLDNDARNQNNSDSEGEDEAVMDLGVGGASSDEDGDDIDDDDDSDVKERNQQISKQFGSSSSSDDSDSDDEDEDLRDWGTKKSAYYHGDTADLELGQDHDDAFAEEEAAKEVQAARYEEMAEEDFMLSDQEDDEPGIDGKSKDGEAAKFKETSIVAWKRNVSKLSAKDRKKLLEKQHPGLLPIVSHFSHMVMDLKDRTSVASRALCEGQDDETSEAVGATKLGKKYLLTKTLLQLSAALNLAMFLLLKSDESIETDDMMLDTAANTSHIHFHPVMKRLEQCNSLAQKLEENVEKKIPSLEDQLNNLVKASLLMESMGNGDNEPERDGDSGQGTDFEEKPESNSTTSNAIEAQAASSSSSKTESLSDDDEEEEEGVSRNIINNARFGLRPNEITQDKMARASSAKRHPRRALPSDFGDDDDAATDKKMAARSLSSTINSIEQHAASKKKKHVMDSEALVEHTDPDDDLRRGIEMMEAEMGRLSDEGEEAGDKSGEDMGSDGDDGGGFYAEVAKKSKAKRKLKKTLYQVAPKYPRLDPEVEGERAIGRNIMKNRGLVPHKNKLNRNPRVKKREQYRKALIRRKGAVREVRTDEGHKYGGEETGIKRGISRSRKLGVR